MALSHSELKTPPSDDQQDPVVSQVTSSHKYYNRKQHIKDADEKPIQELLQNMLNDVPGADIPCGLRMGLRRPGDYLFLMQQFEKIQEEKKVCEETGKQLPASKLYFLATAHQTLLPTKDSIVLEYLEKAATLGHSGALFCLGHFYQKEVNKHTAAEAVKLYENSAAKGDYRAEYQLATYYYALYDNSYLPNTIYIEKAIKYFDSAAKKGCEQSQYMIGVIGVDYLWPNLQVPYFVRQSAETFQWLSQIGYHGSIQEKNRDFAIKIMLRLSNNVRNFSCVYHATMGLAHCMKFDKKIKLPQELLSAFGKLASEHSDKFLTLCKGDPWETVFPLLPAPTAKRLMDLDSSLKLPAEFVKGESKEQPKESAKSAAGSELKDLASQDPSGTSSGNKTLPSVAEASTSLWEPGNRNGTLKMSTKTISIVGQWKIPF